jgi:hypothetical protein
VEEAAGRMGRQLDVGTMDSDGLAGAVAWPGAACGS